MRGYQTGFYDLSAPVRDRESRLRQAAKIIHVLTAQPDIDLKAAHCLDLGCASGVITSQLAPLVSSMVGLDYDEIALRHTNTPSHNQPSPAFIRGDAMQLPFPAATFNLVICAQVYEHVPDSSHLAAELCRVLVPGGLVFFSGPNWLFPVEPHYGLPFLHWLPSSLAGRYLRLFRMGTHYYERSGTWWGLQRLLSCFTIRDLTIDVMRYRLRRSNSVFARLALQVPDIFWSLLLPLFPNFNWILYKPVG